MRIRARGINTVHGRLASGEVKTYYYHRATGARLAGEPGSSEFMASLREPPPLFGVLEIADESRKRAGVALPNGLLGRRSFVSRVQAR